MSDQHRHFLERLDASVPAVFAVGINQYAKGRSIYMPALRRAPSAADHLLFVDAGDLFVEDHQWGRHRFEVKGTGYDFSCRKDWPFKEAFVGSVDTINRTDELAAWYVTVSPDFRSVALVGRSTRPHWREVEKRMSNTGNVERKYACPLEHVVFQQLFERGDHDNVDRSLQQRWLRGSL
jgi:hypothetical protein